MVDRVNLHAVESRCIFPVKNIILQRACYELIPQSARKRPFSLSFTFNTDTPVDREVTMLKSAVLVLLLLSFGRAAYAEIPSELSEALQAYRDSSSKPEELSLAIFQASMKSLSPEEYTLGITEGYTEAYGDVHPVPPKNWRNGELILILMEHLMAGDDSQRWMGWNLFHEVQETISDFAGRHASNHQIIERIFKLAAEFPAQPPEDRWIKNWSVNRRNLIVRTINLFGDKEDSLESLAVVKNVEELLPILPGYFLQGDALRALGQSRREAALPYLMSVARHDEDLMRKLGALLGLGHFAEQPEVLELAREIALEKKSNDANARNFVAAAIGMINNHHTQAQRLKRPVSPRAMEIARELWHQPNRPDIKRWLLYYLAPINEKFIEEIFIEALKPPNANLQNAAMEYSTGGEMILESPLIEEAIREISKNAPDAKQRESALKYLERRREIRKSRRGCEHVVANGEND
jgi:hypothetical protein